jgi:hypothetical protein
MGTGLTSLEAIAEKLQEKRKQDLETILAREGSAASVKNEYNITNVNQENVASSLLFKSLVKPKYDNEELLKAVDTEVKELKPNIPIPKKDLVPKPLYDEQLTINTDLTKQLKTATDLIEKLQSDITNVKSQLQTEINNRLSIEQSNDTLVNQLDTLSKTIDDFAIQISTALQKSIEESILRTSLQAQNTGFKAQIKALIKQIDTLNSIIEGLQAQLGAVQQQQAIVQGTQAEALAAGADVINDVVVSKLKVKANPNRPEIFAVLKSGGGHKWINGQTLILTNNDKNPVDVNLVVNFKGGNPAWFNLNETSFSLPANGGTKEIELRVNEGAAANYKSYPKGGIFGGHWGSVEYSGNDLKVSIKRVDGTEKSKFYKMSMIKSHPGSYDSTN